MNTQRILAIGAELSELLEARAATSLLEWQAGNTAAARRLELTPAGGFEGKNEELRRLAAEKVFSDDELLQEILADERQAHLELVETDGRIAALEAERRALEWQIRAELVTALYRKSVHGNGNGAVEDAAFDDAALDQVDGEEIPF